MQRNFLMGSLVLLAITAVAILCHNLDRKSLRGAPRLEAVHPEQGRRMDGSLFPEQKFLLMGPVDINEATEEDLIAIPRIGPALAKRIIDFRAAHGPIHSLDELLEVKGIGPRILESIEPYLQTQIGVRLE